MFLKETDRKEYKGFYILKEKTDKGFNLYSILMQVYNKDIHNKIRFKDFRTLKETKKFIDEELN